MGWGEPSDPRAGLARLPKVAQAGPPAPPLAPDADERRDTARETWLDLLGSVVRKRAWNLPLTDAEAAAERQVCDLFPFHPWP